MSFLSSAYCCQIILDGTCAHCFCSQCGLSVSPPPSDCCNQSEEQRNKRPVLMERPHFWWRNMTLKKKQNKTLASEVEYSFSLLDPCSDAPCHLYGWGLLTPMLQNSSKQTHRDMDISPFLPCSLSSRSWSFCHASPWSKEIWLVFVCVLLYHSPAHSGSPSGHLAKETCYRTIWRTLCGCDGRFMDMHFSYSNFRVLWLKTKSLRKRQLTHPAVYWKGRF